MLLLRPDNLAIPRWVHSSFYSKTHDKPFRKDRFVPRCKMYEIQMLGILDHNLTTVAIPYLDDGPSQSLSAEERKRLREDFDALTFGGTLESEVKHDLPPPVEKSLSVTASYSSARLLAQKLAERRSSTASELLLPAQEDAAEDAPLAIPSEGSRFDRLTVHPASSRSASPAPSSLSLGRSTQDTSPSRTEPSADRSSNTATPKITPAKRLKAQSSKSSFVSRLGGNWLFGALGTRSQPSFPAAAQETVVRRDVSSGSGSRSTSPVTPTVIPRIVPSAPLITPSTPSPVRDTHVTVPQPLPIAIRATRAVIEEDLGKSLRNSVKLSKSPGASSWMKNAAFLRGKSHVSINPCNPKDNIDRLFGDGRRWQHVRPRPTNDSQHLVKWASLCAPACLPLTTDFMPTPEEIQEFYEINSYDIACYPDQVSFLVRQDAAHVNLPLAVMREMASQRLSREPIVGFC